jgi:hypothetical protein
LADWYASSAAYAAIPAFAINTGYTVGQIVKPIAPTQGARWAMRCTTAGTSAASEPTWPSGNNATVTSGGATFANVSGQSTYFWSAAAGDHQTLNGTVGTVRYAAGDRVFISSDHAETVTSGTTGPGSTITQGYGLLQFLCVNRAGSTPPVAADMATGATVTASGLATMSIRARVNAYYNGIAFVQTTVGGNITFNDLNSTVDKTAYYKNCTFYVNQANGVGGFAANTQRVVFDNTTVQFGNTAHSIGFANAELMWINTPSAVAGAIFPTSLFIPPGTNVQNAVTLRGVDLSAMTGTLIAPSVANAGNRYLFDSCRIASAVTRYAGALNTTDIVEFVNCYDGTNIISESYQPAGAVTTERTITLAGGATDDVGIYSHKLVSGTNIDKYNNTLNGFWLDVEYQTTGSSKTATVEIISSASLNNDEISLLLEYQGTSGSSLASIATSLPATPLTTASAIATSTATWNSSPGTPVKQQLSVTFTPQLAGRVRGQVRLGKSSTTVYVNPVITIA